MPKYVKGFQEETLKSRGKSGEKGYLGQKKKLSCDCAIKIGRIC